MKKKRQLLIILSLVVLVLVIVGNVMSVDVFHKQCGHLIVNPGNAKLYFDKYDITISGYDKDGVTFFFLPSFIRVDKIDQSNSEYKICLTEGSMLDIPLKNQIQDVLVHGPDGSITPWKLGIFQSENLYTMNVSLDNLAYYDVDHDNYSDASVTMLSPSGKITYNVENALIKGRGNGSWPGEARDAKRPFQIKLPEDVSFCGMKRTDKWALITDDETGLHTKLAYDLASDMEMEYAIESDWVDLYINNEYMGLYLLCHEPNIGSGDLDIGNLTPLNRRYAEETELVEGEDLKGYEYSLGNNPVPQGGYLIEKNVQDRYYNKKSGFKCDKYYFSMKSPKNASIEEVTYLRDFVCDVDKKLHRNDNEQTSMIDEYSFARQYLITEISLNPDAAITSYYFYKKSGIEKLYAGPCWDFDGAFGEWSDCKDYTASIFDIYEYRRVHTGETALDWDECLVENDDYSKYVKSVFIKYIDVYENLLSSGVDRYHDKIYNALCMDQIRWRGYDDYAPRIENYYKYLYFFLYHRLKYLADVYETELSITEPDIYDDIEHTLSFMHDDGSVEEITVKDGAQITESEMPEYDSLVYKGWYLFEDDTVHGALSYYDPIFEDRTLVLK